MKRFLQKIVFFFEMQSYGVCGWIARKIGIAIRAVAGICKIGMIPGTLHK